MTTGQDRLLRGDPAQPAAAGPPYGEYAANAGSAWERLAAAPAPMSADHEQAGHELDLVTAMILAVPTAAPSLDLLINDRRIHPEGALVLGALLYTVGHRDGAEFWWKFAAGGGNYTSASCLSMLHRSLGEVLDAEVWRREAESLGAAPRPSQRILDSPYELLPAQVRDEIISRCRFGLDVRLPPRLAAVIHQLPADDGDHEYGEIPQVSAHLVRHLAAAG
ncbi:hypothetical protein [Kitasatospora sp. NPDC088351]|uniref:hypothetical protein n=1 Tax=unclassified Kitasatospora TaxID=2633591 RepID=UPI003417FA3F